MITTLNKVLMQLRWRPDGPRFTIQFPIQIRGDYFWKSLPKISPELFIQLIYKEKLWAGKMNFPKRSQLVPPEFG